jgi:hypothetical protein
MAMKKKSYYKHLKKIVKRIKDKDKTAHHKATMKDKKLLRRISKLDRAKKRK